MKQLNVNRILQLFYPVGVFILLWLVWGFTFYSNSPIDFQIQKMSGLNSSLFLYSSIPGNEEQNVHLAKASSEVITSANFS